MLSFQHDVFPYKSSFWDDLQEVLDIIDEDKVNTSTHPRPLELSSDKIRNDNFKKYSGEPMIKFSGNSNPYIDYQSIDLLLSLQNTRSEGYDEMCFFVMGQVKELLFRGLHFELFNAREQIKKNNNMRKKII